MRRPSRHHLCANIDAIASTMDALLTDLDSVEVALDAEIEQAEEGLSYYHDIAEEY